MVKPIETLAERVIRLTMLKKEYQLGIEDLEKEIKDAEERLWEELK